MKRKKELIVILSSLLVIVLSVSVAYFTTKILGEGKEISVESADLKVIFTSGSGTINGTNIEPGWSSGENTFTVKNESNGTYKYNIIIKDLVNTFVTEGFLVYKITSTDGGYTMTDFEDVPKSKTSKDTILAYNISIDKDATHTYTVEYKYLESTEVDQSADMGKTLTGKIFITKGTERPTLANQLLNDNPTISERTDFSTAFTTNTPNTLYKATENGTDVYYFAGEDRSIDGTCTYKGNSILYFDGSSIVSVKNESQCLSSKVCKLGDQYGVGETVTEEFCTSQDAEWTGENATWHEDKSSTVNNWVKFGKYKNDLIKYRGYTSSTDAGYKEYSTMEECTSAPVYNEKCAEYKYASAGDDMYWRIIRTNADRGIRLLYSGTSPDIKESSIGLSKFNLGGSNLIIPKYVGYMYGDDDSTLSGMRANTNNSTVKTYIDNWYENNFTTYTNYLSNDAIYCNDRELASGETYSTTESFGFKAYERLNLENEGKNASPTYNCSNNKDAFSVNNTEAKLKYPIALMTADEIAYAGGIFTTDDDKASKIWIDTNSYNEYYNRSSLEDFWLTLSPQSYESNDGPTVFDTVKGILFFAFPSSDHAVRPATSLKSCVTWKSGDGSADNPYEILENGGC